MHCFRNFCDKSQNFRITNDTGENRKRRIYEIDFIVNAESVGEKYYIRSALNPDAQEKTDQEIRPFPMLPNDSCKKIIFLPRRNSAYPLTSAPVHRERGR